MKELLKKYPEQYALSISATTRQPREGETDGVEYFFKETKEFEQMTATAVCLNMHSMLTTITAHQKPMWKSS